MGERVTLPRMCPVPFPEFELSEQPAVRLKKAAQASTALALTDTLYLRMPGVFGSADGRRWPETTRT